ncbi:MAG: nucleotide pyrophosphohydrolase [Nitrosomonadaceae bacterium]
MDIKSTQNRIHAFADERNWDQFHNPKNLVMALSVECSELVEIFQWLSHEEASNIKHDPDKMNQISDEIADVTVYLLRLADKLGVDIEKAIDLKMEKNARKYPVEKVHGSAKKYTGYKD